MPRLYFDTSALVKHYHREEESARVDELVQAPATMLFISQLAIVETLSAFATKVRTGQMNPSEYLQLRGGFSADVLNRVYQIARLQPKHFDRAKILIDTYGLKQQIRTLDALQLSVALEIHRGDPIDDFACSDRRLCEVARLSGLSVIMP